MTPGYRRRILIDPAPGCVTAELEDDYHRMAVVLRHAGGIITEVTSEMKRSPWTLCPGAMAQLAQTFTGTALAAAAKRGEKAQNCTHLHDLTLFAAFHADERAPTAYDIHVTDPADDTRTATLARNGAPLLRWDLRGPAMREVFAAPDGLAGRKMSDLGAVIADADADMAEAMRILRWASIIAHGRMREMPAGMSATAFPGSACYNFQPGRAENSYRRPGADIDFSAPGRAPMADRAAAFGAI